ncbi:hypothetical protein CAEBREN_20930 [Caenorhabditis brenneri]|uniref:Uncharacterized protein n=1 Tax=Caenorhabditis brenneri TaxID=135651 RepID=G0P0M0_CAEBE|nr:hypothetical protein CAEBREN_20930 [Caenorhabditis brenneri]
MYLYDPNGSQVLPQIVKIVGWRKKLYGTVTGDFASSFFMKMRSRAYKINNIKFNIYL